MSVVICHSSVDQHYWLHCHICVNSLIESYVLSVMVLCPDARMLTCVCCSQVTVWGDYGRMERKVFMGVAQILLDDLDLSNLVIGWYKLFTSSSLVNAHAQPAGSVGGAGGGSGAGGGASGGGSGSRRNSGSSLESAYQSSSTRS